MVHDEVQKYKKEEHPPGTELDITDMSQELCSTKRYLTFWGKEMRFACLKLTGVRLKNWIPFDYLWFLLYISGVFVLFSQPVDGKHRQPGGQTAKDDI